ncbi:hypothetical protein GPALN_008017 [Globodera pallida]|uniref:t-SNARE coiled-coil homology domain-containing protein n=1 Tax=Globodera pallida TaxID=36090 RepID=A0A183C1F6_GLOPA|nr:hypothetical protein GPALN_008017 [Globodera pallida]
MNSASAAGKGYVRLNMEEGDESEASSSSKNNFFDNTLQQQQMIVAGQDESLNRIGDSLRTLKDMSHQIGDELEDQSEMLDELGTSMSSTEARMNDVMKKLAKLTRLEDESRQCTAIFVLSGLIVVLLIVLVVF